MDIIRGTIKQIVSQFKADPAWIRREVNCLMRNKPNVYEVILKGGKGHEYF